MSRVTKAVLADLNGNSLAQGMSVPTYDYAAQVQNLTTDVWSFYAGGSGGVLVATITITYNDSTKTTISNVAKT